MGARILVVIDVGLNDNAVFPIDLFVVIFVKGQLDVGLTELNLLEATRGSLVKDSGPVLRGKCTLGCGLPDLVHEFYLCIGEEPILFKTLVPNQFFKIVKGRTLREMNGGHGCRQVKKRSERRTALLHQLFIPVLSSLIAGSTV